MSIIPGIETAAPERTETSSGSSDRRSACRSAPRAGRTCSPISCSSPSGRSLVVHVRAAGVGRDREAGRHGNPAASSPPARSPCRRAARGRRRTARRSRRRSAARRNLPTVAVLRPATWVWRERTGKHKRGDTMQPTQTVAPSSGHTASTSAPAAISPGITSRRPTVASARSTTRRTTTARASSWSTPARGSSARRSCSRPASSRRSTTTNRAVFVTRTKEELKNAPEYQDGYFASDGYRSDLAQYYGALGVGVGPELPERRHPDGLSQTMRVPAVRPPRPTAGGAL